MEQQLKSWANSIADMDMMPWSTMPQLDLYMDQVITLMNCQLEPLAVDTDRPLTPSMINNYVKDGVMPRPNQKKYNREHLTILAIICMLKSEFSLPEIRELVSGLSRFYSTEELYCAFRQAQTDHLRDAAKRIEPFEDLSEAERFRLAMELALEANAKRIAATKLLASLIPEKPEDKPKDKEKKKKKDDSEKE